MIGAGLILSLVSTVINTAVTATGYYSQNITMTDTIQVPLYWVPVVEFLNGIGVIMAMIYGMEFAMAQTPNRMRGIMMGLVTTIIGWCTFGSKLLSSVFKAFTQKYILYSCLVLPPLAMLMLIIFVLVAKRYKLRERERHVAIVENITRDTLTRRLCST